jgi:hypothetical protein
MLFAVVFVGIGSVHAAEEVYLPEPDLFIQDGPFYESQNLSVTISSPAGVTIMVFRGDQPITSWSPEEGCTRIEEGYYNSLRCDPGRYDLLLQIRENSGWAELYVTVEYSPPGQGLVSSTQAKLDVREVPEESEELECGLSVQRLMGVTYQVKYFWKNASMGPHFLDFGTTEIATLVLEGETGGGNLEMEFPFVSRMLYKSRFVVLGYPDKYLVCEFAVVMPDALEWETRLPLVVGR